MSIFVIYPSCFWEGGNVLPKFEGDSYVWFAFPHWLPHIPEQVVVRLKNIRYYELGTPPTTKLWVLYSMHIRWEKLVRDRQFLHVGYNVCAVVMLKRLSEKLRVTWSWLRKQYLTLSATRRNLNKQSSARTRRSLPWLPNLKMNSPSSPSCRSRSRNFR